MASHSNSPSCPPYPPNGYIKEPLASLNLQYNFKSFETWRFGTLRARATFVRTRCFIPFSVSHPRPVSLVTEKYQLASGVPVKNFP